MNYKYLIIGGGIAGTTAAEAIRKNDSEGSIIIIEDEKHPLYSRISLYDFIADQEYGDKIFLRNENHYKENNIDLMLGVKAEKLDVDKRTVRLNDGSEIWFEKLLVASGGAPSHLDIDGVIDNVFYYQNLDDAKKIKERLPGLRRVAVLGASFAAFELVELFRQFDIEVDMFVRRQFLGGILDDNLDERIKNILSDKKINIRLGREINSIKGELDKVIIFSGDDRFEYDGAAIAVGLKRNVDIFKESGLDFKNGILASEFLKSNKDDVFVAGDIAEYFDISEQKHVLSGSWTGAFMQGKIAGENMTGKENIFKLLPTYTCSIFDDQFTFLGHARGADEKFEKISRNDLKNGKYAIFYLKDSIIKGVAFMNSNEDRAVLTNLINKKIDVSKFKNDLRDPRFNLQGIL